jgi:hypothetical protein
VSSTSLSSTRFVIIILLWGKYSQREALDMA